MSGESPTTAGIVFEPSGTIARAGIGANLLDVATAAGVEIDAPCGGEGRCGRCKVHIDSGSLGQQAGGRLSADEVAAGHALACRSTIAGDAVVSVMEVRKGHEWRPRSEAHAGPRALPLACDWQANPAVQTFDLPIGPPSLADNTSDLDRVRSELSRQHGIDDVAIDLEALQHLARVLRETDWHVAVAVEMANQFNVPPAPPRIVAVMPHDHPTGTYGLAVDVGTTSVVAYLIDFATAEIVETASSYNGQIACGDDVIARIVYSQRDGGLTRLQDLVVGTINRLVDEMATRTGVRPRDIHEVVAAGNTTMIHLLLGLDPKYIREEPYIPTVSFPSQLTAAEIGLHVNPQAGVRCMPAVGSYVGGDISAGVLSTGMYAAEELTLFIDIGTNGEMVLGNRDWLISCACSAGPAFEGGGVASGMRATAGAIEDVWVDPHTYEPTIETVEDVAPVGLCGSGLIDLLGELFVTGVVDKSGGIDSTLDTPRVRKGDHGPEYVVVWAAEAGHSADIVITEADINNLLRAKAAVYAGFSVLCSSVGVDLADVERLIVGGAFGQYLDPAKAIEIGLLPDLPVEKIRFMGNTSAAGAYTTLMCTELRQVVIEVARKTTYLELSADNSFMDAYTSALFLPHTDIDAFPTVKALVGMSGGPSAGTEEGTT